MENYTLNRFYHEAKALIEKHGATDDEKRLNVSIAIDEQSSNKVPLLKCTVVYSETDYHRSIYGFGNTPSRALEDFENTILERQAKMLTERVSVDITDELISEEKN